MTTENIVFTSAQNYTAVDQKALAVLKNYCKYTKSDLIVLPLVYNTKEKDLFGYDNIDEAPMYDPEIQQYMEFNRFDLNSNLEVIPGVHTRPTSKDQLSGLATVSEDKSAIFAGARHRLATVPTPGSLLPKIICTAPTVTYPKYSSSSSGITASFMHQLGAVVVEVVDDRIFHLRQLTINDKYEIHDLGMKYKAKGKPVKATPLGVVLGDLHEMWADDDVRKATFEGPKSIVRSLKVPKIVVHDFIDFYSANHHHVGDRLIEFLKNKYGYNSIKDELMQALQFIHNATPKGSTSYIVGSNHNDALDRWLNSGRGDTDPVNAPLYHLLNYCRYTNAELNGPEALTSNPIEDFAMSFCPETLERVKFVGRDESLKIGRMECMFHGDKGSGGARGNIKQLSNIGSPVLIGHSHGPQIYNGSGQVGTSSRYNMGYNAGTPSNWLHTHALINADGTWTLLNIIEGEWRG